LITTMGHIAVPFKANEAGKFKLDKDLMVVRQQILEDHTKAGGIAGWFPEGQMNDGLRPENLGMFRAGGFALCVHVDVEIWCVSIMGASICWPTRAQVGGRPAEIKVRIVQMCESSHRFLSTESGGPGLSDERVASVYLAEHAHDVVLNALKEDYVPDLSAASPLLNA